MVSFENSCVDLEICSTSFGSQYDGSGVSPSGVSTTTVVFPYIICIALTIFFGMSYA